MVSNRQYCKRLLLAGMFALVSALASVSAYAITPPGTPIQNTASAAFDLGGPTLNINSNTTTTISTIIQIPSTIQLMSYLPAAPTISEETLTSCRAGAGGPFNPSPNPEIPNLGGGTTVLDPSLPLDLAPATQYHIGQPAFVLVNDQDQNLNPAIAEIIIATITSSNGDQEDIQLTETDVNTGEFIGYIQTTTNALVTFNCELTVTQEANIQATYTDQYDGSDVSTASTLVDPFGVVFDSTTGDPVDGVIVTLIDAGTGLPAIPGVDIFGDDGVSSYPNTLVTGSTVTDSGSTVYNFPAGNYRFPLLAPKDYRLEVTVPASFSAPSVVPITTLQTLPGAPFALLSNASFGNDFTLNAGPPLRVDIPIDPLTSNLVLEKTASDTEAGIGDFVQYKLNLENADNLATASGLVITDILPVGFRYKADSAKLNNSSTDNPSISSDGRTLSFAVGSLSPNTSLNLSYVTEIVADAPLGDAINNATAVDVIGTQSNLAQAKVQVIDELLREKSFVVGRVLLDNCPVLPEERGNANVQLLGKKHKQYIRYTANIGVEDVQVSNYELQVTLSNNVSYIRGTAKLDDLPLSDPVKAGKRLIFRLGAEDTVWPNNWQHKLQFTTKITNTAAKKIIATAYAVMDTRSQALQRTTSAEVAIEKAEGDSGVKRSPIIRAVGEHQDASVGTELEGLEGVRIYMEDGTYVVSDAEGKFHFEGVHPGTHVLQLDPNSLPEDAEVFECEQNTRFAGNPYSRFIDVQGGSLWRADFHVRRKAAKMSDVSLRMLSQVKGDNINFSLAMKGGEVAVSNYRLTVLLPNGMDYIAGSSKLDGQYLEDPEVRSGLLVYRLGEMPHAWDQVLTYRAHVGKHVTGPFTVKAFALMNTETKKNVRIPPVENIIEPGDVERSSFIFKPKFTSLSTVLSKADQQKLNKFINKLSQADVQSIQVVGHSDNVPISKRNQHIFADNYILSEARARSVADYIQNALNLESSQLSAVGMGPDEPIASNKTEAGKAQNRRTELIVNTAKRTDSRANAVKNDSGLQSTQIKAKRADLTRKAAVQPPQTPKLNIKMFNGEWSKTAKPGVEWLMPAKDYMPSIPAVNVAIKHYPQQKIEAMLNGKPLNPLFHFGTKKNKEGTVARSYWQGIHLEEGDNELSFTLSGVGETTTLKRTIHYGGVPVKVELAKEYSYLVADGKTAPVIALRFFDKWGKPARPGTMGTYRVAEPYYSKELEDATQENPLEGLDRQDPQYKLGDYGIALIELEPTTQTGKAEIHIEMNGDRKKIIKAWLQPELRDWIVVGLADGVVGDNDFSGNKTSLEAQGFEEDGYEEGRLSLFAKGRVKENWLLTASYDTDKEEQSIDDSLFQNIDPDTYFTLYGDRTNQRYEAPSSDKLYIKMEREQFYGMYGDYDTGLSQTELSTFNRSVTGLKSEYGGNTFSYNLFATETSHNFAKDELRGDGTSGLYRLNRNDVVINSETITIETRNRFHSEDIIDSKIMVRHLDYSIDYQAGTIFFKQPVASKDLNFNPIYIVIDYEVETDIEGETTAGGRAAFNMLNDKLEVGISAISDGTFGAEGDLQGVDITLKTSDDSELKVEFASSDVDISGGINNKGDAHLVEYSHTTNTLDGRIYVREQEAGFGLGQQAGSESGTSKYGVDGSYKLNDKLTLDAEVYHEEVLTTKATRDVTQAGVSYTGKRYVLNSGLRLAKDEDGAGNEFESQLLLVGAETQLNDGKVKLRANSEIALSDDDNPDFPNRHIVGVDYWLKPQINLFAEQEFTQGQNQDSNTTRLGVRTLPWKQAQLNTSVEREMNEYGPRVFATLGLTQGFKINDVWSADFGLDRTKTMRDPGDTPFNINVPPASGTLNDDFTAVSMGATRRGEFSTLVSRLENRNSETEDKLGLLVGWEREQQKGIAYSWGVELFDSEYASGAKSFSTDIRYSLAHRPVDSHWIMLNRLDFKFDDEVDALGSETRSRKIINNWKGNYMPSRHNQIALSYGLKYVLDNFDDEEYSGITQFIGAEYRHDISGTWDLGVHGHLLNTVDSNTYSYSYGISTGWNFVKNLWFSVGYNFDGFEDADFTGADYTAKGLYLKLRFKFDQNTFKKNKSTAAE